MRQIANQRQPATGMRQTMLIMIVDYLADNPYITHLRQGETFATMVLYIMTAPKNF